MLLPKVEEFVLQPLANAAVSWMDVPMLARTHGQPATPTRVGKELMVFVERLKLQIQQFKECLLGAKFGGATGGFNAHYVAYPAIHWLKFADSFISNEHMGGNEIVRQQFTTQIEHYDQLAAYLHCLQRINTILLDMCRDIWQYISMDYFKQKIVATEVGSSAMPHKVNPIDFENAEGNLGLANAIMNHIAAKLPISRLQRDLTDSTVVRNLGVPLAHSLLAYSSIHRGLSKIILNEDKIQRDLTENWVIVSEAIQTVLRRAGVVNPYEVLKQLTRTSSEITRETMNDFIRRLDVSNEVKEELLKITPFTFIGVVPPPV